MSQQGHQVGTGRTTTDLSGRRGRVLSAIRAADTPASIESLAAELDLHPNTVRFHTSALEEAGLIEQGREQTGNKGRPRAVFVPTSEGARSGARNYQLLAAVLVDQLAQASPEPLAMARSAGRSWVRPWPPHLHRTGGGALLLGRWSRSLMRWALSPRPGRSVCLNASSCTTVPSASWSMSISLSCVRSIRGCSMAFGALTRSILIMNNRPG